MLKLDKLGDNLDIDIPRVTWLKFMFLLGAMALMAAHIIFAYASNSYWESDYPDYGLTYLPFIINYTMQLYIVVREVRKCSHRHQACLAYWAIISASELVEIVVVEVRHPYSRICCLSPLLQWYCRYSSCCLTSDWSSSPSSSTVLAASY